MTDFSFTPTRDKHRTGHTKSQIEEYLQIWEEDQAAEESSDR